MSTGPQSPGVAVLGAGSWGTALALLVARNGFEVRLWDRCSGHIEAIGRDLENRRHLPGVALPASLKAEPDLQALTSWADHFLVVVPSHGFRPTLVRMAGHRRPDRGILVGWGTKGFDPERRTLLSEVVAEVFPGAAMAAVSGPSFAAEVAQGLPTALTVASPDLRVAETVAAWLRSDRVRVYTNPDLAGVQLGGAIKNVMALAAGISDGLGFGANARAALITRGLAEMKRLGVALGGNASTFMGLTGVGDLVLTCTDDQSRNRRAGIGLGRGRPLAAVLEQIGQEVEGVETVRALYHMAADAQVEMPITEQVYRVVYEGRPAAEAVVSLLGREPRPE